MLLSLSTFTLVTLVTLATLGGLAWVFARWYARPKRSSLRETPTDHGLPYTPVSLASGRARLDAWLIPRAGGISGGNPTVVIVHGWSSNKASMLPVAVALHDAFNLLLFDARGHGASGGDGPITIRKFAEDIVAVVDYLEQHLGADTGRLGVLGHSIGGGSAILAASFDCRIRSVVSSSAFADPARLTRRVMERLWLPRGPFLWVVCRILEGWLGVTMREVAPERRIGVVEAPILLLHGTSDRYVPASDMEAIYAGARAGNVECALLSGCRHTDVLTDDRYSREVVRFLTSHLGPGKNQLRQAGAPVSSAAPRLDMTRSGFGCAWSIGAVDSPVGSS